MILQRQARFLEEYAAAAAPLIADLARAGFVVGSVGDLWSHHRNYKAAIPIMIRWLPRLSEERVTEDVVRSLTDRAARPVAAAPLIAAFRRASTTGSLQWAIGNALSVVADDSIFDDLVELLRDKRWGIARQMIAVALGNMKDPRAPKVLVASLDDEDVVGHAVMGLAKLKAPETRSSLEAIKDHPRAWVRKAVARALARLQ